MSLILEALRKSEAERRRGAAPSLYAEMPPAPATASRLGSRWPLWAGLAILVPVAAWLAFATISPKPVIQPSTAPMAQRAPALAPVRHLEARALPPVPRPNVPPSADEASAATLSPDAPPAPVDDEPQTAAELAASIAARAQAAARIDHDAVAPPAPGSVPAAMTSPGRTLSLSDLSSDERKALPPLKMSMHLWNEDPSRRLVIIDGDRLHEGDRVGNAVVTAILSDGVLLDWNGRQLKLPIR